MGEHEYRDDSSSCSAGLKKALAACLLFTLPIVLLPSALVSGKFDGIFAYQTSARTEQPANSLNDIPDTQAKHVRPVTYMTPRKMVGYDTSVLAAMKEMGLTADEIDAWIAAHRGSALRHLKYMSERMQKIVASTALFIRKSNSRIGPKTSWREAAALVHYSTKYGVPLALATAVAHTESTFDPNALSKKGASGVMQVRWRMHKFLLTANGITASEGANPLSDPEQAIAAGCLLLSRYLRAYGSVADAMERYYGGSSLVYQTKITRGIARVLDHHADIDL